MADKRAKSKRTGVIEVMEDGRTAYEYSDGALRYDNGQLARRHPKSPALFNSETGTQANNGRHARVLAAREQALIRGAQDINPEVATVPDAAALITEKQMELATSPDMGHASTQAAKYLDKTLSLVEDKKTEQGDSIQVTLTGDTVRRVLDRLANRD